jgi:hypothetical protein
MQAAYWMYLKDFLKALPNLPGQVRWQFIAHVGIVYRSDGVPCFSGRLVGTLRTMPRLPPLLDSLVQTGTIVRTFEVSFPLLVDGIPLGFHHGPSCTGFSRFIGTSEKKLKGCNAACPIIRVDQVDKTLVH